MREGICLVCMKCSLWWDFRCTISGVCELDKLPTTCDDQIALENVCFLLDIVCYHVIHMATKFENILVSVCGDMNSLLQSAQIFLQFL